MRILCIAAAAAALSGCVYIDGDGDGGGSSGSFNWNGAGERLYAASVEDEGVRIRAPSNGCTNEDSFRVRVDRADGRQPPLYRVRFDRDAPDRCRAMLRDGVELFFPRARLGLPDGARIMIENAIAR